MKKIILLAALVLSTTVISQGALTWTWISVPGDPYKTDIQNAMNTACNNYNQYANFSGTISVKYNSGVPTAQTDGYQGWIEFGGSRSSRVAQHEMGHWNGCGTYWDWNNHRNGNLWTGSIAINKCNSYGGGTLYADTQHFWPYGWNYDNEGPADHNIGMVSALCQDMGLNGGGGGGGGGGNYKQLKNHATGLMIDGMGRNWNGADCGQWGNSGSDNQKWTLSNNQIQNKATGLMIDGMGRSGNGSVCGQWSNSGSSAQKWNQESYNGCAKFRNQATGLYLDGNGFTGNGSNLMMWSGGGSWNQEWIIQ